MQKNTRQGGVAPIILIGVLFFIFGFITWANSQLIPYLKIACELTDTESYLVATAFFAAYFFMAIPSSVVLKRVGFKKGISLGLLVMAVGCVLFIPAANTRSYPLFLTGLFIIGTGLALLQTAANPYVTILGPIESAATRISIMGICNKVAAILSVYVLGSIILDKVDDLKAWLLTLPVPQRTAELDKLAQRVIGPYIVLTISLAILAVVFYFIHLPDVHEEETANEPAVAGKTSIFQFSHLLLGALAIFVYVGVEVISYDTFTPYGEFLGYKLEVAKAFATYTGYALLAGYLVGIVAIPTFISQTKALVIATLLSMVLVFISVFTKGTVAVASFALLGFSNSVMWPAIWPLALNKLGKFTKTGSALLIMGIVGGAILTPLYGKIAEAMHSKQQAYLIMIPCYLFILYYALKGSKIGVQK